ncbi:hypothetical protein ACFL43_07550, partial [Thermodesulfobacteriota bacterium]
MKKPVLRLIVIFAVLLAGCSRAADDEQAGVPKADTIPRVEVKAATDRTTATIADQITYTLSAVYAPDVKITMPEVGAKIAGLRIVDFGEDGPRQVDSRMEYRKWYRLQADIAGAYIIPSMTVSYVDGDGGKQELQAPQIFLEVKSTLTDEEGERMEDIVDIKPRKSSATCGPTTWPPLSRLRPWRPWPACCCISIKGG